MSGSFVVKKIIYGGFGEIISFWATFVQYSDGSAGALTGEIKFNADATGTPVNQPPGTYAGPNQRIPITSSAKLSGIASDDGLLNPTLTITWQAFMGPGTVNFANASAAQTTATFSVPGQYTLRLTAYDGEHFSSSDVVIDVYDPNAVTSLTMTSESGDYVGAGLSYSYTQSDGISRPATIPTPRAFTCRSLQQIIGGIYPSPPRLTRRSRLERIPEPFGRGFKVPPNQASMFTEMGEVPIR